MINNVSLVENIERYKEFIGWAKWFPDLFYDLITPKLGGIRLDFDQRLFLRAAARFFSMHGCLPRGAGKTLLQIMASYHAAIFYPDIQISVTAQSKENATAILEAKHNEIIRFYPLIENELLRKPEFPKNGGACITFKSGGMITALSNTPMSKGQRRHRINVEESDLMNQAMFEEVVEPIANVPRRTIGPEAVIDPQEPNGQIHFFTTPGFKGSDEYYRALDMLDKMAELKGRFVLGADWELACMYGRGEPRSRLLEKKATLSSINFARNYGGTWTGSSDNSLVNINKLLELRVLQKPELKAEGDNVYILGMDVAQSFNQKAAHSCIGCYKLVYGKTGKVKYIDQVNIFNLPNGMSFEEQAVCLKKTAKSYKAAAVVIDGQGLGKGLVTKCLEELTDPETGEIYESWDTLNTEDRPKVTGSPQKMFIINSQAMNEDVILSFMGAVEDGILRLLVKKTDTGYDPNDIEYFTENINPHIQTDAFVDEVANLKRVSKSKSLGAGTTLAIDRVASGYDKDRYSACAYALYFVKHHWNAGGDNEFDYCYLCD